MILQVVPEIIFELLDAVVALHQGHNLKLPERVEKAQLRDCAHLSERAELAKLTQKAAAYSRSLRAFDRSALLCCINRNTITNCCRSFWTLQMTLDQTLGSAAVIVVLVVATLHRAVMYVKFLETFVRITRIIRMYPYKRSFLRTFGPEGRDTERTLIQRVQTYKNMIYLVKYESTVACDL